jgi:inorganic pyrophosphatase
MNYLEIPTGEKSPEIVNAIIEIPLQSSNKYEYDKKLHVFRLDRTLHSPVHYPGDYGFIPSTLGLDNDPLDILVLVEVPSFPGCLMEVRPIGVLRMVDQGQRDSKILAVTHNDPRYNEMVRSTREPHLLRSPHEQVFLLRPLRPLRHRLAKISLGGIVCRRHLCRSLL